MIVQVEDQKGLIDGEHIDTRVTMQIGKTLKYRNGGNIEFKKRMSKGERLRLRCSHCNATRHEIHECFKLNDYPD